MKILLVEDDEPTASALSNVLTANQFIVNTTTNGKTGLALAQTYDYDLLLLDVMLPDLDGISLCRQVRSTKPQVPILMLTAKQNSRDRILGLEAGADDYVVKPFDASELIARIRALLRRGNANRTEVFRWEKLQLNPYLGEVSYNDQLLTLTPKEYGLLELFLRNPRQIFSRSRILDLLWSAAEFPEESAVTTHIKTLRQKLTAAGLPDSPIETIYGLGYRLKTPPTELPAGLEVMADLAEIWQRFQGELRQKLVIFEHAIEQLKATQLERDRQQQAIDYAHQLIGSLGALGFPKASEVARQIEQLLLAPIVSQPNTGKKLAKLVNQLNQIINQPTQSIQPSSSATSHPFPSSIHLLMVDDDPATIQQVQTLASAWGLRVSTATHLANARTVLAAHQRPDLILLDLSFANPGEDGLTLLAELAQQSPKIPVIVMTGRHRLIDRVEVARLGGQAFLRKPLAPASLRNALTQALRQAQKTEAKILVVDDDPQTLTFLQSVLEPWGLQVLTLEDPQQFWDVLEMTAPDLLILDIEMPHFSGFDLAQAVRNDPLWNNLALLMLSAHRDAETIRRVFTVGADDYVSKPIVDAELIVRVLNRLERVQIHRARQEAQSHGKKQSKLEQ